MYQRDEEPRISQSQQQHRKNKQMISIQKVEKFPEISRSGRISEELQLIIDAIKQSADSNEKFCIKGVEKGKAYNSMQQRIRAQAKKLGYNIVIRFDADESSLYFKASKMNNAMTSTTVTADKAPNVKSNAKTSTK
jgi:hypothetical protein